MKTFYAVARLQSFNEALTNNGKLLSIDFNEGAPKHFLAVFTSKAKAKKWNDGKEVGIFKLELTK